ncbi:MAG TPA: sugar phosphate nucleotidyltransferase, partial [Terriglobia bacterium]|nr:sugar phosphate nucleotidyltransferase [Terriglobia bacterium]
LYRMNFQALLEEHGKRNADVTVAVIPRSEDQASEFGLMKLADDGRIVQFREKPKGDLLREMRCDTERFGLSKAQAAERPYLASMGIYVFKRAALEELLRDPAMIDFGHQVIPRAIESHAVYGFPFDGYWEDLGTAGAFYRANIDLTSSKPHFDFHDMKAPIYTHARFLPPTRMERCEVRDSIVAEGALLKDAEIASSIVGIRAVVAGNVTVDQTLLMGADYYEDEEEHALNRRQGIPDIGVGPGSVLRHAIVDKNARIGANVRILNEAGVQHHDGEGYYIRDGVVMIPKNGVIPDGTVI